MKHKYIVFIQAIEIVAEFSLLLLFLRVIGRLFGISAVLPVISWVYGVTNALLVPFDGFIKNPVINQQYVLDITALLALVSYTLVYYLFSLVEKNIFKIHEKKVSMEEIIDAEILSDPVTTQQASIPTM